MNSSSKEFKVLPSTPYTPNSYKIMSNAANAAQDKRPKSIVSSLYNRSYSDKKRPYLKQKSVSSKNLTISKDEELNLALSPTFSNSSYEILNCSKHCESKFKSRIELLERKLAEIESELDEFRTLNQFWEERYNALSDRVDMELKTLAESSKKPKKTEPSDSFKLMNWIKLGHWFKQRPTRESLREKNIYNDEPCFDTEIEMVLKHEHHKTVPMIVVDCCDIVEEKVRKSNDPIEGLYRQSGDHNKIQFLRFQIDNNNYNALRKPDIDIHTLTGVLKLFFREIKSPLISSNEARTFIGRNRQWDLTDVSQKIEKLKSLVCSLPETNRATLEYLFGHFNRLIKMPVQQIHPGTLAISIAPSIFHTVQKGATNTLDIHEILKDNETLSNCIQLMIEFHSKIFISPDGVTFLHQISMSNLRRSFLQLDLLT